MALLVILWVAVIGLQHQEIYLSFLKNLGMHDDKPAANSHRLQGIGRINTLFSLFHQRKERDSRHRPALEHPKSA